MTGLRRTLCILAAFAAIEASPWVASARADEVQDTFNQGVDLLQRGRRDESLAAFRKLLGMSPTSEQAYELWKNTPNQIWSDLMVEGGDFQLIARRLMRLSLVQRAAHKADKDAILALVKVATDPEGDAMERMKAVRTLGSEHGEYAAPFLIGMLGNEGQDERQVKAKYTLIQLGSDVVLPLMAALHSEDAVQRRNVALVLAAIGDVRSVGALQMLASADADETVKRAASEGLAGMKAAGDPASTFLALGNDYFLRHDNVLSDDQWSDVLWSWKERALVSTPVPRELYNDELSKLCYLHVLHLNPGSTEALAGLARSWCDEMQKLARMEKAGQDVGEWKARSDQALAAVHAAGVGALDLALSWSVQSGDSTTGSALCRVLGPLAPASTPGLQAAAASHDGALRSEGALALATIALRTNSTADESVVAQLAESVGREVARIALVIDANAERSAKVAAALEKTGVFVTQIKSGALGLLQARRAGGLDVVLLADTLPDITAAEILDEFKADARLTGVPVIALSDNAEQAAATYGDKIKGVITNGDDIKPVTDSLGQQMSGDRALAEDLAARAGNVLHGLCQAGRCACNPGVLAAVGAALTNRPDSVAVPALGVLGCCGSAEQAAAVVGGLGDEARSEDVRRAAGNSLAGMLGRNAQLLNADALGAVAKVATSGAPASVREAASRALALADMDPKLRAMLQKHLQLGAAAAH